MTAVRTTRVSGSAPGADLLAVRLWHAGVAGSLELHLPAALDADGFDRGNAAGVRVGGLHDAFRARLGMASVDALLAAVAQGTRVSNGGDFAARDATVAPTEEVVKARAPCSSVGGS
jgi:hypothetical protein